MERLGLKLAKKDEGAAHSRGGGNLVPYKIPAGESMRKEADGRDQSCWNQDAGERNWEAPSDVNF